MINMNVESLNDKCVQIPTIPPYWEPLSQIPQTVDDRVAYGHDGTMND